MWKIGEYVGDNEGRMDVCVAAAGVLKSHTDCLEYPAEQFRDVRAYSISSFHSMFSSTTSSVCLLGMNCARS